MESEDLGLDLLVNPKKKSMLQKSASGNVENMSTTSSIEELDEMYRKKKNQKSDSMSESEESSIPSEVSSDSSSEVSSYSSKSGSDSEPSVLQHKSRKLSPDEILNAKREILYQFDRLEKKGINVPKKFTLASSLEEMKTEYEKMKKERQIDVSIRWQRGMLMTIIGGIEMLNDRMDPFDIKLNGWSESVNEKISDYDDIFEELHERYKGTANMPPEVRLILAVGGSAIAFHLHSAMFKKSVGDYEKKQQNKSSGGGMGGLMSGLMGGLGSMFGGGGNGGSKPMMQTPMQTSSSGPQPQMRGPTDVEDILREMQTRQTQNERIEVMSTISESDIDLQSETSQTKSIYHNQGPKKRGPKGPMGPRRTLNL